MSRHRKQPERVAMRLTVAGLIACGLHGIGLPVASGWVSGHEAGAPSAERERTEPRESTQNKPHPESDNTTPSADLVASQPVVPPRVVAGGSAPLQFTITNVGELEAKLKDDTHRASAWWTDAAYLSEDALLDTTDHQLATSDALPHLSIGGAYNAFFEADIPAESSTGHAYVLLVADDANDVEESGREANNVLAVPVEIRPAAEAPPEPVLGEATAVPRVTVAWISHEAFEQLQAGPNPSETVQPALQRDATPVPGATLRAGQTEPAPSANVALPAQVEMENDTDAPSPNEPNSQDAVRDSVTPPIAMDPIDIQPVDAEPELAEVTEQETQAGESATEVEIASTEVNEPDQSESSTESTTPSPPSPDTPPQADAEPRPSSAPQGDADTDPADLEPVPVFRAGKVEVAEGLTVTPSRPDFSVPALVTSIPRNPQVQITFDLDGTVLDARLVDSAGSEMLDAPIRASLYRWRASGDRLATWDGPRQFTFTILLTRTKPSTP